MTLAIISVWRRMRRKRTLSSFGCSQISPGSTVVGASLYAVCSLKFKILILCLLYLDTRQILHVIFRSIYLCYFNYSWAIFRDFNGIINCWYTIFILPSSFRQIKLSLAKETGRLTHQIFTSPPATPYPIPQSHLEFYSIQQTTGYTPLPQKPSTPVDYTYVAFLTFLPQLFAFSCPNYSSQGSR